MKFPLPLQIPANGAPFVTQPFGPTTNTLESVGPNGESHYHYGADIVPGNDHDTFGASLRCPFPTAAIDQYLAPFQGMTNSPYVQLAYKATDGTLYECTRCGSTGRSAS